MKMILGSFVFDLTSALPDQIQVNRKQTISTHKMLGQRDKLQHLGPAIADMTLSGKIFPNKIGHSSSIDLLDQLADTGEYHWLACLHGKIWGKWMIESVSDTRSSLDVRGNGRQIDFNVKLKRGG